MANLDDKKQTKEKRKSSLKTFANVSQIGFQMAASVLIGVFIGKGLDERLSTSPFLIILFSILGIAAAFMSLLKGNL